MRVAANYGKCLQYLGKSYIRPEYEETLGRSEYAWYETAAPPAPS